MVRSRLHHLRAPHITAIKWLRGRNPRRQIPTGRSKHRPPSRLRMWSVSKPFNALVVEPQSRRTARAPRSVGNLALQGVFDAAILAGTFSMLPGGLLRILPTTQMCISMKPFVLVHHRLSQSQDSLHGFCVRAMRPMPFVRKLGARFRRAPAVEAILEASLSHRRNMKPRRPQ